MTALYLIAQEYRAAAAQLADLSLDEQTIADTMESLAGPLEDKARAYGFVIRTLEADADAWAKWIEDAKAHEAALRARAGKVKTRISQTMQEFGIVKVEGPGITLSFRKTHAVVIDDADQLPAQYMRQKPAPPPEPDKPALAAAMKLGEVVPGAHMETRQSLQIK